MKVITLDRRFTLYHRGFEHAIKDVPAYGDFLKHVKKYFENKDNMHDCTFCRKRVKFKHLRYTEYMATIAFKRKEDLTMVLLTFEQ